MLKLEKTSIVVFISILALALYTFLPFDPMVNFGLSLLLWVAGMWMAELWLLPVTALAVPVLAGLTQTPDAPRAMANFAHPIILLNLGSFSLAAALHLHGVGRRLGGLLRFHVTCGNTTKCPSVWYWLCATACHVKSRSSPKYYRSPGIVVCSIFSLS